MRLFNDKLSQYIWYLFTETQYEVQRNVKSRNFKSSQICSAVQRKPKGLKDHSRQLNSWGGWCIIISV